MRVGLVCPYSFEAHGGVQNHVLDLAGSLRRAGHHVEVLAPGEHSDGLPTYVSTTGRAVPVPYNGSVARVSFGPLVAARVRRWLDTGAFDVLHIHEPATPSVSVLALWAADVPVVATYHTAQSRPRALETSAATFLRPGLDKIAAHIAVSAEARSTLTRYQDVDPVVIPNGVHTHRFRDLAGPSRRTPEERTLVFVGRADEPRKGLDVLLESMPEIVRAHPGARLVVVGAGAAPGRGPSRGLPAEVARRVRFLGPVGDQEKAAVLAGADVLVAPNRGGESFGIVLVEAMAAGLPLVVSDIPAFTRLVREGRCGETFRNGDAADLARVTAGLLADSPRRERLAVASARFAGTFDWSVLAPRVLDVYRSVAARPSVVGWDHQ